MIRVRHAASLLALAAGLAFSLSGFGASAAEGTFEDAIAAFDEASASKDTAHPGYARAFEIWSQLAEEGDAPSRYHLGILHLWGLGGAKFDQQIGQQYVREAADAGYPVAQSLMGFFYENASGDNLFVSVNPDAALAWYTKGAEAGHCVSVRRLAKVYRDGELGVEKDEAEAARWTALIPDCKKR